ncbi:MAG: META domain-containing protein [Flavobacteriaceae bacterium]|jgi:heat shock protein HslJ|nr:META domain-containing protein [Flavobacteriaceae bacterium]
MKKLVNFGLTGMFLSVLAFTVQSCETVNKTINKVEDTVGNKELESQLKGTWILKTIENSVAPDAFKGTVPYITFDTDNHKVSGNAGCNNFTGSFALLGSTYAPTVPASTLMACIEANQETKLLELLGKKSSLVFNNYTLQFVQNGKVVLEFTPKTR